jgi:FkbM family methyltransferase
MEMSAADPVSELQAAEIAVFRLLGGRLENHCMIDVGAHHGSTLLPFLEAGWRVYAFEPVEANRARLLERCGRHERLTLRPEAVSNCSGTRPLHLALSLDGSLHEYYHSLERTRADRYHRKGETVEVRVVSLDDLVVSGEIPQQVGFLKIDTEGHDLAVLQGASRLACDVVSVEFWGDRHPLGKSPSPAADMIQLMSDRGYSHYLVLCHHAETMFVLGSTFKGVPPTAWGNIVFFAPAAEELHRELLAQMLTAAPDAAPAGYDPEALLEESRVLQQACDERLRLLHQMHDVAEERLALIHTLDADARRLAGAVEDMRATAERRLDVIRVLDAEVRRLGTELSSRPPPRLLAALRWFMSRRTA